MSPTHPNEKPLHWRKRKQKQEANTRGRTRSTSEHELKQIFTKTIKKPILTWLQACQWAEGDIVQRRHSICSHVVVSSWYGTNLETLWGELGFGHSKPALILKKASWSFFLMVSSSSRACERKHVQDDLTKMSALVKCEAENRVQTLLPSFWASADPSSPSSAGCVAHPTSWASESRSQSVGDIFHSAAWNTRLLTCEDSLSDLKRSYELTSVIVRERCPSVTCSCCSSLMLLSHWPIISLIWFSCFCCWCSLSAFCRFSSCTENWSATQGVSF